MGLEVKLKPSVMNAGLGERLTTEDYEVPFWRVYSSEELLEVNFMASLYEMQEMPKISSNEKNDKIMRSFVDLIQDFNVHVIAATKPCNCLCFRTSCFCCFKGIFGTLEQMRFILEKNFDGKHFEIRSHYDGIMIDAMFFPASNEKVMSIESH